MSQAFPSPESKPGQSPGVMPSHGHTGPVRPRPSLAEVLARHRVIVCVGTGGVGKTTVAASLGLAGALAGRRTMVLTIDPARQLARALGLRGLELGGERVDLSPVRGPVAGCEPPKPAGQGFLEAGMLDPKPAWDAFVARHAPNGAVREALLGNPFYGQLSSSMAGAGEYMAMEALCLLDEGGRHDLIVIDTPPAAHAVDFLRAPQRIETLFDPQVSEWFARPYRALGRGAFAGLSSTVRLILRQLQRVAGQRALREISAFFVALASLMADVAGRAARTRALLCADSTAFVLVTGPSERVLAEGQALLGDLAALDIRLRAAVINRLHPLVASADVGDGDALSGFATEADAVLAKLAEQGASDAACDWLRQVLREGVLSAGLQGARLSSLERALPADLARGLVPELDQDAHSLHDLATIATRLGLLPEPTARAAEAT